MVIWEVLKYGHYLETSHLDKRFLACSGEDTALHHMHVGWFALFVLLYSRLKSRVMCQWPWNNRSYWTEPEINSLFSCFLSRCLSSAHRTWLNWDMKSYPSWQLQGMKSEVYRSSKRQSNEIAFGKSSSMQKSKYILYRHKQFPQQSYAWVQFAHVFSFHLQCVTKAKAKTKREYDNFSACHERIHHAEESYISQASIHYSQSNSGLL